MITYVNSVLISNLASGAVLETAPASAAALNTPSADFGKWVVITTDDKVGADASWPYITTSNVDDYTNFKIGVVTNKNAVQHKPNNTIGYEPIVKWSNVINKNEIKSYHFDSYAADTEDTITIDFYNIDQNVLNLFDDGGKRIIVRLTFKDLPTRYRKWTESYEYVTASGDTAATIAANLANIINAQYKRARVQAVVGVVNTTSASGTFVKKIGATSYYFHADADQSATTGSALQLVALPYDDDNSVDSLNWANQVRFNANVYYTDPAAEGWESLNKHYPTGVTIDKVPGKRYVASAKLVRDRESQAMGYLGILNRGNGTWPIIQPEMQTNLNGTYDAITLEFETSYRAADDITRKTKQCVEVYGENNQLADLKAIIDLIAA